MKEKNLVAIFDFDGVIFDYRRFVEKEEEIFSEYGINRDMFWEVLKPECFDMAKYNFKRHIKAVEKRYPSLVINRGRLLRELRRELFSKGSDYLLDGALDLLCLLKKNGWRLYMISHGWGFQQGKIYTSGMGTEKFLFGIFKIKKNIFEDIFQRIIVTPDKTKVSNVEEVLKREEGGNGGDSIFVLVDDRASVIDSVSKHVRKVITVQLMLSGCPGRSEDLAKRSHHLLYSFEELKQLLEFFSNLPINCRI